MGAGRLEVFARPRAGARRAVGGLLAKTAFLLVAFWLLLGFVIAPLLTTVATSVSADGSPWWAAYASYFSDAAQVRSIANTLEVGALSVLTCGLVGTALAVYVRFFCRRFVRLVRVLLMVPLMVPGVIIVVAFIQLYGESGMVASAVRRLLGFSLPPFAGLGGIVLVITYTQYVYFYLNLTTALSFIDANVVDSVRSLGGGPWRVFTAAIWPTVRPAVVVSALTTFVSAIGSYSAPALIGGSYRVLSTQIVAAKSGFDMPLASVEVVVLFAIGVAATAALGALRRHYESVSATRARWWEPEIRHTKAVAAAFRVFALIQLVLVFVPVATIVYLSFMTTQSIMMDTMPTAFTLENYEKVFTSQRIFRPLGNSLIMAFESTAAVLVLVVPTVLLARGKGARAPRVAELMMALPWCMPASVIAIGLINEFARPSVFSFGTVLVGTFEILPIAYAVSSLPLLLSSTQVALGGVRQSVEEAARSLGASPLRTFFDVTFVAMLPGIVSGSILCFVRTVGEYTMSALLYGVFNRPISVSIVTSMQEYAVGTSMAYGALVIALCSVLLVVLLKVDESRLGLKRIER